MLEELLAFENNSNVLDYHYQYNHTLIWPFVRFEILRGICYKAAALPCVEFNTPPVHFSIWSFVSHNIKGNPFFSSTKDIMFLYGGYSTNIKMENGKWFNRIFDYLYEQYPTHTYMLENVDMLPYQRRFAENVKYTNFIDNIVKQKIQSKKASVFDRNTCKEFIHYLQKNIPFKMDAKFWSRISQAILYYAISIPYKRQLYYRLFEQVQPKVVFIEDGCYGARNACILELLNSLGIISIELQHGWIGRNHEAYNYSELLLRDKEYRRYMPIGIALYGSYWASQIRLPIKKYVLGNPHFTAGVSNAKHVDKSDGKKHILFIANDDYYAYQHLLEELLPRLGKEYAITFRLHPAHKAAQKKFKLYERYENFTLFLDNTIYDALAQCEFVTGDMSTALYEAAACGKKILIFDTKYSRYFDTGTLGPVYQNAEQFLSILSDSHFHNIPGRTMFETNWKNNYKRIIKKSIELYREENPK